jgi:hypothetical protein
VSDEAPRRQPGWREVLLLTGAAVAVVFGAAFVTGLLPDALQNLIYYSPIAIFFLIGATGWHLWRISRRRPDA